MNEVLHSALVNPIVLVSVFSILFVVLVLRWVFLGYPKAILPRGSALGAKEQAIIAAAADALFPPGGPIPVSGTQAGLVLYMDTYVRRVPPGIRVLLRLLIAFIEHGPWLFGPRHVRFTRLSPSERVLALEDMVKSSLYIRRVAFYSIRTILSMGYLANATVMKSIGCAARRAPFEAEAAARSGSCAPEVLA